MFAGKILFAQLMDYLPWTTLAHIVERCEGNRSTVRRSTLADTNERRDWRIPADFSQRLVAQARWLYGEEDLGLELSNTVYALDSTTIDRASGACTYRCPLGLRSAAPRPT